MRNILKIFFSLLIAFIIVNVKAQDVNDYVVTIQGDTITGEVKALAYGNERNVQIIEPGKKKVTYPFFKIKSFTVGGEVFQPVKGPSGYTFMKPLKTGYLSLYAFQAPNQSNYDGMYLLKKDGTGMEVPNLTFKKAMRNFLDDCGLVSGKISNDELNKRDLYKIIDEYNACIEGRPAAAKNVVVKNSTDASKRISAWDALENKVKDEPEFAEKENALEMISEIKSKIAAAQKIPNFLLEGLKSSLPQDTFKSELDNALKEIN